MPSHLELPLALSKHTDVNYLYHKRDAVEPLPPIIGITEMSTTLQVTRLLGN
jgi:hypothetical protein